MPEQNLDGALALAIPLGCRRQSNRALRAGSDRVADMSTWEQAGGLGRDHPITLEKDCGSVLSIYVRSEIAVGRVTIPSPSTGETQAIVIELGQIGQPPFRGHH